MKTRKMANTSCSSSAPLWIFLMISWSCVTLSDELMPLKRLTAGKSARNTCWRWTGTFWCLILVIRASLVWAKLILGRFRDAVLPDFSRFPACSGDDLNAFFTDPSHGRYLEDMSQVLSFYARVIVCYIARNSRKKKLEVNGLTARSFRLEKRISIRYEAFS